MAAHAFGLDIGRSFIKIAQIKDQGKTKLLTAAGSALTPSGGLQTDSPDELKRISEAIKVCVRASRLEGGKCNVSIMESQAVTRLVTMPNLTDKELSAAINWEADKYIPLPIKDVNLQYKVVSRFGAGSEQGGKMEVLLVAAPKRVVDKYVAIVKNAGLELNSIETESAALARALSRGVEPSLIVVSFGSGSTELVAIKEGNVIFTRSIATGGGTLTKAVMAEFDLPQNQAEEYKHTYGIMENQLGGKIANVLRPILDVIVGEILKTLEFSKNHIPESQLSRIVVCGGGSYMPGVSEYLTEKTSLEVSLADPWDIFSKEGLILKMPGQGAFYATATGLTLRP